MMILAEADEGWGCQVGDFSCNIGEGLSGFATSVAGQFVETLAEGTIDVLKVVNSFWMYLPTPDVNSDAIETIQSNMAWYTYFFAVLGLLIAIGKMLVAGDFKAGTPAVKMIINLILVTGFYTTAVALLLKAGDAFAPWIIERATGEPMSISGILTVSMFSAPGVGPGLLLVIIAFLGALANALFMLVRGVMIAILVTFLPILAASSASDSGDQAWKKAQGYLLAFLLFKPVAAVILALGLLMISDPEMAMDAEGAGVSLFQILIGISTLVMVAFTLPALIKFIVPVAAAGSSAFSGGALAAGGVAAGASVVAMGASMGAGAAARAGAGVSTAATTGAATSGGGVASGGGTAATSAAPSAAASGSSASAPQTAPSGASSPSGASASRSDTSASQSGPGASEQVTTTPTAAGGASRRSDVAFAANSVASGAQSAQQNFARSSEGDDS